MMLNERTAIYRLKGLAIISIVFAHVCRVEQSFGIVNRFFGNLITSIGSFGVPIFLFVSGYLFYKSQKNTFKSFLKSRATGLFVPWLFWGTLIYFCVYIGKDMSFLAWIKYIVGIGPGVGNCTPFYYLTMILVMYLMYFKFKKNTVFIVITMILSFVSIMVTSVVRPVYEAFLPYINPFNWMFYFGAGLLVAKKADILKTIYTLKRYSLVSGIILLMILAWVLFRRFENIAYWKWYGLPTFFVVFVTVCGVITYTPKKTDMLENLGKYSFAIYLVHSPFASVAENLKNLVDSVSLTVIVPWVVLAVVLVIIYIGEKIAKKLKLEKVYGLLLGFR